MTTIRDIRAQVEELKAVHGFAAATLEQQLTFLVSEVGEVAREVLRLQNAPDDRDAREQLGMELYDVIWNACAIADLAGVDIEACIARKVAINRTRIWHKRKERDGDGGY